MQETLTYLSEIEKYDMLILDVTLPDGTGFEICEKVRKNGSQIPIIFLTASDEEVSIIRGLDCGGDDYITKPFKLGELCSRIRALLRRAGLSTQGTGAVMECGDIKIDLLGSRVLLKGKILELTAAEYRLICLLVKNANRIITRDIILDELWDSTGDYVDNNTLARLNRTKKPFAKPAFWRSAAACRYWQGIDYKTEVDSCGRADRQSG